MSRRARELALADARAGVHRGEFIKLGLYLGCARGTARRAGRVINKSARARARRVDGSALMTTMTTKYALHNERQQQHQQQRQI